MSQELISNKRRVEKALLVIVYLKKVRQAWTAEDILEEMKELVSACDGEVVDSIICKVETPTAHSLIGEGKLKEIEALLAFKKTDVVIFSHDLKGSQQRNIEDQLKVKTIDRTQLILDIFARRATSLEGKTQVELAQLEYLLPRLSGHGTEMSRLGGGIGTLGPGETKLEVDRRRIAQRITSLKRNLADIAESRSLKRKKRKENGVPLVSLVGYTNAGKSTLLNSLTEAEQPTKDGLFTTLDSLSKQMILPNHQKVVLSDTVGFMRELPHRLIEAFMSTLEEVREADLILHVLDISNPNFINMHASVMQVLEELDAAKKPIITVLNKIDKLEDRIWLDNYKSKFPEAVLLSAKNKENIAEIYKLIIPYVSLVVREIDVQIPITRMDLVNLIHKQGEVYSIKYYEKTINIRASVPVSLANQLENLE
ncbi:MAG: GTPase HflX [Candidatus Omnitrophica bacterium]|nr:GTPase HflX [Candidatus Omnitrophota bacterium]